MADEVQAKTRGMRKERRGVVKRRSGDKPVVVEVERRERHPLYSKEVRHFHKFHAHDEKNEAKVGDVVVIQECRPLSRQKRWRIVEIVGRVPQPAE